MILMIVTAYLAFGVIYAVLGAPKVEDVEKKVSEDNPNLPIDSWVAPVCIAVVLVCVTLAWPVFAILDMRK